jgi:hypothetical protein
VPQHIQGATIIGLLVFFSYAIVLNTVVPISLYVSVEVCGKFNFLLAEGFCWECHKVEY